MNSIDIEGLFHDHTIDEIKVVERQIRGDVEKRKEELRILVGERYRDLINAADTIQDMKTSTNEIFAGISSIADLCSTFSFEHTAQNNSNTNKTDDKSFYSLATQMNLLVDTPEKIWSALDNHEYLLACQYYLLSQHIVNASLNIDGQARKTSVNRDLYASFPILHHQWAAISHFKPSILKGSINSLKDCLLPDKQIAENLCAISLLDNYSPRQVFTEFLLARKSSLQDIFHPSLHSQSVKGQILDVVYLLQLTIQQIITLFYTQEESSSSTPPLYYDILNTLVNPKHKENKKTVFDELFGDDMEVFPVSKYVPDSVTGFIPKLRGVAVSISVSYIQTHVTEWINGCLSDVEKGVATLLSYVNNIKGLAAIRDAVYQLLTKKHKDGEQHFIDEESEDSSQSWLQCCQITLNRPLNIWEEFLQKLIFKRAKEVLTTHLDVNFKGLWDTLHATLTNLIDDESAINMTCWDHDMIGYMWYDFHETSLMDEQMKEFDNILSLKTKAYTPAQKSVCDEFNGGLHEVLEDINYFIHDVEESAMDENMKKIMLMKKDVHNILLDDDDIIEPFQKYADAANMKNCLIENFNDKILETCRTLDGVFEEIKNELYNRDINNESSKLLDKATFLSRFCLSLTDLCDNILYITDYDADSSSYTKPVLTRRTSSSSSQRLPSKQKTKTSKMYNNIKKSLTEKSEQGFLIWCDFVGTTCKSSVEKIFGHDVDLLILSTTNWEDVAIKEESENGKTIDSTIKLPGQMSFYLSSLLYRLSEELHRSAVHVVNRNLVTNLMSSICSTIFKCHASKIKNNRNTLYQNRILQMLFDVKFLLKLFAGGNTESSQTIIELRKEGSELVKEMEEFIDPFDLDVFMPHVDIFVKRQLSRTLLLYSCFSNIDKHMLQVRPTSSSYDEQHSAVLMINNPSRFMLLPVSGHTNDEDICQVTFDIDDKSNPLYVYQYQTNMHDT